MGERGSSRIFPDSYYVNCRRIRGCPVSLYLNCPVFKGGGNCWDAPEKCMDCQGDCESCEVYKRALELGLVNRA